MSDHIPDAGKMVSDTPRTDRNYIGMQIVPASFAMQLERELHAANERIKRLEEAGDAMVSEPCEYTFEQWIQAKEAKP